MDIKPHPEQFPAHPPSGHMLGTEEVPCLAEDGAGEQLAFEEFGGQGIDADSIEKGM